MMNIMNKMVIKMLIYYNYFKKYKKFYGIKLNCINKKKKKFIFNKIKVAKYYFLFFFFKKSVLYNIYIIYNIYLII